MNYDKYEDELDRMRMRRQRKKEKKDDTDFEVIDLFADDDEVIDETYEKNGTSKRRMSVKNQEQPEVSGKKTGKGKRKGTLRMILAGIVLFLAAAVLWNHFTGNGWWTVAVFGVDSRDGNLGKGALSDVELVASINKKSGEIRLLSVFRDSYLQIDSEGTLDKINEAYFLGSHDQAVQALETNLDIKVDDYATFNWKAVVDAINVLGGVDIEITDPEFAYINSFITETVNSTGVGSYQLEHSGLNHLDGVQAVAYARLRLMDTDFNRTERQRKVLGLALEKAKQADAGTLATLVGTVFPQISTSIGVNDLTTLARNPKRFYISETSGFPFSHTEMKIGKKSCVVPTTLESNVVQLHAFLYGDENYSASSSVQTISSAIAAKSGLSDPGKDTESGKNVGASGNTGEAQSGSGTAAAPAPVQTAAPETESENVTTETETSPEEIDNAENETEEETVPELDESENVQLQSPLESGADSGSGPEPTEGQTSSEGPSQMTGSQGPSQDHNPPDSGINASLEAPGQSEAAVSDAPGPGQE
jgi:LCP family protein required for cell wall assembly